MCIRQNINNAYLRLQLEEDKFEVEDISNLYFGRNGKKEDTLISYYNKYLAKIKRLIGKDIKEATYKKFQYVKGFLESFIQFKYKTKDIPLKRLELLFLEDARFLGDFFFEDFFADPFFLGDFFSTNSEPNTPFLVT